MNWQTNFNPALSLWTTHKPGHTPHTLNLTSVHIIPQAACALLVAAQFKALDQLPTEKILLAIRNKQTPQTPSPSSPEPRTLNPEPFPHSPPADICFYHEEPTNHDQNAAFFSGLPLSLIWTHYRDHLPAPAQAILQTILTGLAAHLATKLTEDRSFYPNAYLGDLTVLLLVAHAAGDQATVDNLIPRLDALFALYASNGWGWGEDMSDIYAKILADQLSILIFLTPPGAIPPATRAAALHLLNHLLHIADFFHPGPRVPAIRTYDFLTSPSTPPYASTSSTSSTSSTQDAGHRTLDDSSPYRASVRPWLPNQTIPFKHSAPIGHLLHQKNWHQAVAPPSSPTPLFPNPQSQTSAPASLLIPLFDPERGTPGAGPLPPNQAHALRFPDFRIGGVSRFPIMPTAEHHDWGLSWQSMPVAFWHQSGAWAFLQWAVNNPLSPTAPGPVGHPALFSRYSDLSKIQKSLTPDLTPPLTGETFSLLTPTVCLVLRRMPHIPSSWSTFSDHLRLIGLPQAITPIHSAPNTLTLPFPSRTLHITYLNPWHPTLTPTLCSPPSDPSTQNPQPSLPIDFGPSLTAPPGSSIKNLPGYTALWAITFTSAPLPTPTFTPAPSPSPVPRTPSQKAFTLRWPCPQQPKPLTLTLDPLSPNPMTAIAD